MVVGEDRVDGAIVLAAALSGCGGRCCPAPRSGLDHTRTRHLSLPPAFESAISAVALATFISAVRYQSSRGLV